MVAIFGARRPAPNGRLVRFTETETGREAVLFDVFADGDDLRCREVDGDREERWSRGAVQVYAGADGPFYVMGAQVDEVATAADLVGLEERIAFRALNERTQESGWTYTTILLAGCLIGLLFVLVLAWNTSGAAAQALKVSELTYQGLQDVRKALPTPMPPVR